MRRCSSPILSLPAESRGLLSRVRLAALLATASEAASAITRPTVPGSAFDCAASGVVGSRPPLCLASERSRLAPAAHALRPLGCETGRERVARKTRSVVAVFPTDARSHCLAHRRRGNATGLL